MRRTAILLLCVAHLASAAPDYFKKADTWYDFIADALGIIAGDFVRELCLKL